MQKRLSSTDKILEERTKNNNKTNINNSKNFHKSGYFSTMKARISRYAPSFFHTTPHGDTDHHCDSIKSQSGQHNNQHETSLSSNFGEGGSINTNKKDKPNLRRSVVHNGRVVVSASSVRSHHRYESSPFNKIKWRLQCTTYNFLERPGRLAKYIYHLPVFILILSCSMLYILSTIEEYENLAKNILNPLEITILIQLTLEFILRLWACGCRSRYQGLKGRIQFCKRFFVILDVIIILGSIIIVFNFLDDGESIGSQLNKASSLSSVKAPRTGNSTEDTTFFQVSTREMTMKDEINIIVTFTLRLLRFLPIIRIVRMDRRGNSWKLLASVVRAHSRELLTSLYIGIIVILFGSYVVYEIEKNEPNTQFKNYADGLWWGVVSLTTIGYGKVVPESDMGRLVSSLFCIIGISFFSLPAGILGTGFAFKVQEQHRQKHFASRRVPAAILIQSLWRAYAAHKDHTHLKASWIIRKPKSEINKSNKKKQFKRTATSNTLPPDLGNNNLNSDIINGNTGDQTADTTFLSNSGNNGLKENQPSETTNLLEKAAGKFMKSLEKKNLFESLNEARNDSPKVSTIAQNNNNNHNNNNDPNNTTNSTVPTDCEAQNSNAQHTTSCANFESVIKKSKVMKSPSLKLSLNNFDPGYYKYHPTECEKIAIHFIRIVRFRVAKRKFSEILRPYDVQDIVEQYASGHLEMLDRIKDLQTSCSDIGSVWNLMRLFFNFYFWFFFS